MNNEINYHQRAIEGTEPVSNGYRVKDSTLYRKCNWTYVNNKRISGYLPVLKKDGSEWVGYNYSARDMATAFLHNDSMFSRCYHSLKWVEIGRGIGGRGTSYEWQITRINARIITKMINPTIDMLLPMDAFEE